MASLLTCIRGLNGLWFRSSSPVRAFIWGSKYSRYSLPSLSGFKTMFPQRSSFCSSHPRRPKWIMLFSHTVFNGAFGELNPNNFLSNRISISSSARAVVAFGLLSSPRRLSCFRFAFNASLVFEITVFEDSFAVTGATQMVFNTGRNSAERWRFIVLSSLSAFHSCS